MFPVTENVGLWIFCLVWVGAVWLVARKVVRKQAARAPKSAFRTQKQRWFHRASLLILGMLFGYIFAIDGTWLWATSAVLATQVALLTAAQAARFKYQLRLWLLAPISLIALVVGCIVSVWPVRNIASLSLAPWPFLALVTSVIAASYFLSMYSFPVGHGERAL